MAYEAPGLIVPEASEGMLPPPEDAHFETPLLDDGRGLVDIDAVIRLTLHGYEIPPNWADYDIHHVYWPEARYSIEENDGSNTPYSFRRLPINCVLLPRDLHDRVHTMTLPPPMPPEEVMEERIIAWGLARRLFESSRSVESARQLHIARKLQVPELDEEEVVNRALLVSELERRLTGEHATLRLLRDIDPDPEIFIPGAKQTSVKAIGKILNRRAVRVQLPNSDET